jgi:succinate-semialdehyde dehydrogenase/glutarate-semialdehyde dehydrogenase
MKPTPKIKTNNEKDEAFVSETSASISNPSALPTGLFIGGAWKTGRTGRQFDVIDPANETLLASVEDADPEDAKDAVDAASKAAAGWAALAPRKRADILMQCYTLMKERAEWFARLITRENGKALSDARGEVAYAAEFFRWYAEEAVRIIGDIGTAPGGAHRILVQYQPMGIAVLVTPWNFPAAMATRKIAPALAAGCTCVLKPAAETPLTALAIAALMYEAGVPAGVVNVVTTTAAGPVVSAMLHDTRVRKVSFTGSTAVGRILLREAADQVLSCSMELGGNAPFIVFDDADIDAAIEGAMLAKMRNGGEACTAANRFYVQRGIFERFAKRLSEEMEKLCVGPGSDNATQCGPLITRAAVQKIDRLVRNAVEHGGRILTGGAPIEGVGYFYPPTVIADVKASADILRAEIFGPVAVLVAFDDVDEVVALANDTEYGLVSYVYTADLRKGLQVSERLETGMVGLNRGLVSDPAAPFGGVKQSGLGREGGHIGLHEFMETKYIALSY